jgi:hypothetical protein
MLQAQHTFIFFSISLAMGKRVFENKLLLHFKERVYFWVSYDSQNKQRLFP